MFGYTGADSILKNIGLIDCDIKGKSYVGSVVGYIGANSKVQNCYVTGKVSVTGSNIGGVVGYAYSATVQNCYSVGNVIPSSTSQYIGGVLGCANSTTVQNCYSTCSLDGSISGTGQIGGVVGYISTNSTVQNCYATGIVSGYTQVGGVVGTTNSATTTQNCVALASNIKNNNIFGRLTYLSGGTVKNSFGRSDMNYNDAPRNWTSNANGADGASITAENWGSADWWRNTAGFSDTDWDFADVSATRGPILRNMPQGTQTPVIQ